MTSDERGVPDPASGPGLRQAGRAAERFATGVPNLDQVLGGGLLRGSTVMVIGPPGSGKTVLGQQIAFAGARRGEVALYFTGFSETYEVLKVRGGGPLAGVHSFVIDATGLHVYPRLESVAPTDMPPAREARARLSVAEIDGLLGGGVNVGTATLAAGAPGLGKTLLGLHLLTEGARQHEPGLFVGFTESAVQLRDKASTFGLQLEEAEAAGTIRLLQMPPHDFDADRVTWMIREDVEARGVRRLVIDSATELEGASPRPSALRCLWHHWWRTCAVVA